MLHRMQVKTSLGEALNFSANMTAFTATGMEARIKRTENKRSDIPSMSRARQAESGEQQSDDEPCVAGFFNRRLQPEYFYISHLGTKDRQHDWRIGCSNHSDA